MICELTGMEVANASMYDGSTAAAEAAMMAVRLTGRRSVVVARSVHPEYREVLTTYARNQGLPLAEVGFDEDGRVDLTALEKAITPETACVLIQSPNFFGTIEDVAAIAEIAHKTWARCWWFLLPKPSRWASSNRRGRPTSSPWKRSPLACRWALAGPTAA